MSAMERVRYSVYASKEAALADGWPDAEYGVWQRTPASPELIAGWIALDYDVSTDGGLRPSRPV